MIKKLTSMLLVSATATLLSSYSTIQQDGNFKCKTIRNGQMREILFSYDRSKKLVTLVEVWGPGDSQVVNMTGKTSEINGIVRSFIPELDTTIKLDKSKMRLDMSHFLRGRHVRSALACRWI